MAALPLLMHRCLAVVDNDCDCATGDSIDDNCDGATDDDIDANNCDGQQF